MSDKINPDRLELRAAPPHRVVRFRKSLVIGLAAVGIGLVLTVTMLALKAPKPHRATEAQELYNIDKHPTPDGLAALPGDYAHLPQKPIELGPPLPGDLGRPILAHQRAYDIAPGETAEEQRLAQQSLQAKEAGVFFRIDNKPKQGAQAAAVPPMQSGATTPSPSPGSGKLPLYPERDLSPVASANGDQNNQQRKLDFVNKRDTDSIYNPHALQTPASPYQVMAGSVIAASLITGVNSDLPGLVVAQVTENLYDTVTGQTLLIPQGSRLIGAYDSVVAYGQSSRGLRRCCSEKQVDFTAQFLSLPMR